MRSLTRITADSFRDNLGGFGFWDLYQPGEMELEGFDALAATGAKIARMFLRPAWDGSRYVLPAYQLMNLERACRELQRRGMYAGITLGTATEAEHARIMGDPAVRASWIAIHRLLAKRFKGRKVVAVQQALNEPKLLVSDDTYWSDFIAPCVAAIAEEDPGRVVSVGTWPGARMDGKSEWGDFWRKQPHNVVMSPHLYSPHQFTHNGTDADWAKPAQSFVWDKTLGAMHHDFLWALETATAFDVPVWVSELSAQAHIPGQDLWAAHAMRLFRGAGWSWSWHQFYGAPRWHPNEATLKVLSAAMRR